MKKIDIVKAWELMNEMLCKGDGQMQPLHVVALPNSLTLAWIMGILGCRNWMLGALELDPKNVGICIKLSISQARLSLWDVIGQLSEW